MNWLAFFTGFVSGGLTVFIVAAIIAYITERPLADHVDNQD